MECALNDGLVKEMPESEAETGPRRGKWCLGVKMRTDSSLPWPLAAALRCVALNHAQWQLGLDADEERFCFWATA